MILLLAGTSDARLILQRLKENHAKVAVSVTTEYGAALLHEAADLVNQNRLDACGLQIQLQHDDAADRMQQHTIKTARPLAPLGFADDDRARDRMRSLGDFGAARWCACLR